ncbi:uncharacterized protein BT62DRAFT_993886 [Guyanagaster necrorhizus]|uniref:Uncharacterized protein n=1 Tax=Guyanagaster necrorhizus TaxID=856835 RepID=A0A9P7VWC0_9AGAR|nr:uncharacterized protein BT62DRAFT_993886 [Guyanagaster necrorhizus MCA 3950]KAG7447071.1 hypothetical protein BT62DRAFT_993886 [Guyanagaster necrorhizus MCA 3950]
MLKKTIVLIKSPSRATISKSFETIYHNYRKVSSAERVRQAKLKEEQDKKKRMEATAATAATQALNDGPVNPYLHVDNSQFTRGPGFDMTNFRRVDGHNLSGMRYPVDVNGPKYLHLLRPPKKAHRVRNEVPANVSGLEMYISRLECLAGPSLSASPIRLLSHRLWKSGRSTSDRLFDREAGDTTDQASETIDDGKGKGKEKSHKRSDSTFAFGHHRPTPRMNYNNSQSSLRTINASNIAPGN